MPAFSLMHKSCVAACDRDYTCHIIFYILLSAISLNISMYKIHASQIKADERKSPVGARMLDNIN